MSKELEQTNGTTVRRHSERTSYDRDLACAMQDEGMVAHSGFNAGDGAIVVPLTSARLASKNVRQGAAASRWLSNVESAEPKLLMR